MSHETLIIVALCMFGGAFLLMSGLWLSDMFSLTREIRKRELLLKLRKAEKTVESYAARHLAAQQKGACETADWFERATTVAIDARDALQAQYEREFGGKP